MNYLLVQLEQHPGDLPGELRTGVPEDGPQTREEVISEYVPLDHRGGIVEPDELRFELGESLEVF